jgi:hypothetical protein
VLKDVEEAVSSLPEPDQARILGQNAVDAYRLDVSR